MSKNKESPLLSAAGALAEDIDTFEALSLELSRLPIHTDKSLARARQGLQACSEHETKLAGSLHGFAAAMQAMQERQRRCMEVTAAAAARVQQRQEQRMQLEQQLAQLGASAQEVSEPVAALFAAPGESPDLLAPLAEVERRLDAVIEGAGALCDSARQGEWHDLERDTQSLREKLQALRNRVLLMRRKLSTVAPS
jgi:ABC-type transporter Mla subunit MlaD